MNIDIKNSDLKTVEVGQAEKGSPLFSIEKPKAATSAVPLAGASDARPSQPHPQPTPQPRGLSTQNTRVSDAQDMLNDFANPGRQEHSIPEKRFGSVFGDSLTEGSGSLTDDTADDKSMSDFVVDEQPDADDLPSTGFASIDDEKSHILWKLSRAKRSGMPVHRNLSIDSSIRELRNELKRVEYELSLSQSLRFQKKMLCLAVSGLEVVTERYSLFDLQLKGWSSSVQDDIDSFDGVLARLHDKYKDRAAMPPELQLLLMLLSSAISFHVTRSMMKSISQPGGGGLGGLLQSMMGGGMQKPPPQQTTTVQEMPPHQGLQEERPPQVFQRAPMKGPTGMFGSPAPMAPPQNVREPLAGQKRDRDNEEIRSDIVSESSAHTSSDHSTSEDDSSSDDEQPLKIQTVPMGGGRGRGRGRGRGSKTIIQL